MQVRAGNRSGNSAWSSSATGTPAKAPDAPAAPTVSVWNAELRVSWTAPAGNGAAITDYDIQYRACTATPKSCTSNPTWGDWTEWNSSDTSTTTAATITGLTNDTAYQVQVRATNSVDDSAWSTATKATPTAQEPDTPAAPTVAVWNAELRVSWTAPSTNGTPITGYDVQHRACTAADLTCTSNPSWGDWTSHTHTGTGTTTAISSLTNGTAYQVQVQADSAAGTSGWSGSGSGTPAAQKPDAPAVPSLTVMHQGLAVSWTAPAANGAAVSDYDVQYQACTATDGDTSVLTCATNPTWASWREWNASDTGATTSATITGLTNGTAYQVQVRATNSVGDSDWSAAGSATPAIQAPDAPAAPTLSVWNAELRVSWTAPASNGATITDYDVHYRACTATDNDTTDLACDGTTNTWQASWTDRSGETTADTATSATITGLTNGTAYQVQVRAANSVGDSAWSASSSAKPAAQLPGTPSAPTLSKGAQQLAVSWSAPAANGSAITDYDVQYRACTATDLTCATNPTWGSWSEWNASDTGTTRLATITGLPNGTTYQVQVRAHQQRRRQQLVNIGLPPRPRTSLPHRRRPR